MISCQIKGRQNACVNMIFNFFFEFFYSETVLENDNCVVGILDHLRYLKSLCNNVINGDLTDVKNELTFKEFYYTTITY